MNGNLIFFRLAFSLLTQDVWTLYLEYKLLLLPDITTPFTILFWVFYEYGKSWLVENKSFLLKQILI